ncbi:murein hydrolase activator EnvC family protein [Georgfuchsia toluolica]|nr:peptidoglycan DD-metalloendopeptidase family protein [Georgfuchsia toluolica]
MAAPIDAKRKELKTLQSRLGALQSDLTRNEASKADAADKLRDIESSISVANRRLRGLGDNRAAVLAQLSDLERQSQQLAVQIERQQQHLSRLLYQQFVHGNDDALHVLLAGGDPNQSARERYFLTLLSREKANLLDEMRAALKEKNRLAAAAQEKNEELAAIEKQQQTERTALLGQQKERQILLAKIANRIKAQKKQIDTLKGNEKRLTRLIDGLARLAIRPKAKRAVPGPAPRRGKIERGPDLSNVSGAFAALRGRLHLPVRGAIADRFGSQRGDRATTWKGIFIRASEGSDVHAVADGTVVYADWLRGFGNLMIVDHGDDFLSVYGNNQSLLREAGQDVKAGEAIATVGASGGGEESGLYFELRHQGQPFDPLRWISLK